MFRTLARSRRRFTANFNVTILDGAPVTFGDYCMVGPGTLIATTGHPMDPQGRRDRIAAPARVAHGISFVWVFPQPQPMLSRPTI